MKSKPQPKKSQTISSPPPVTVVKAQENLTISELTNKHRIWALALILFSCVALYWNIYDHQYVLDDLPTIQGNRFVQQGIKGFKDILTTRAWDGYNKDINIAAYRPMQLICYAIEYQFLGRADSRVSHLVNIFYYAVLSVYLYFLFQLLFRNRNMGLAALITAFFIVHPLHSEVVSNLKSRDELLCLMFSILATFHLVKFVDTQKTWQMGLAVFLYFLALLSKETPVVFIPIIPLTLYFFRKELSIGKIIYYTLPFVMALGVFVLIRYKVFDWAGGKAFQHTHLQNPILAAQGFSQITGTKFWVLGKYIQLLFFPHPLTFTYFYNGIPLTKLTDWQSLLSIAFYVGIGLLAIKQFKERTVLSYGILVYLIAIALFSNFFVKIGDAMGERLAFTPSLGYCIVMGFLFSKFLNISPEMENVGAFFKENTRKITSLLALLVLAVLIMGYSWKTHTRNMAWHDNTTLCLTDYPTSPESYILNRQLGLTYFSYVDTVATNKPENLKQALFYFTKAVALDPSNPALWLKYGEAQQRNNEFTSAQVSLQQSLQRDPTNPQTKLKLAEVYRRLGNFAQAIPLLRELHQNPQFTKSYYLNRELALNYYFSKQYPQALPYFQIAYDNVGTNMVDKAVICSDMGALYVNSGDFQNAYKYFTEAIQLHPNYDVPYNGAGVVLYNTRNLQQAITFFEKAFQLNPNNIEAVGNAANTHQQLGNQAKYQEYMALYQRLTGQIK